ncbi:palmitoyltransferase ZDHHC22 [Pleurodeles waltl]|uniref:palmitoyltransferase ZDHHC22 n=1 Tax=Pleurodeles waltl TaxID=8319 RepID=UPI003709B477
MLILRLLNVMAPAYFIGLCVVTFALQLFFFLPCMIKDSSGHVLSPAPLMHVAFFLFLVVNVVGNYILVIRNTPEDLRGGTKPDVRQGQNPTGSHYCRLCSRMTLKHDHHCFFTGNCVGNSNMRNFVMFCFYTGCSCFYSMVLGVAYVSALFAVSFANPLTFLRLLPLSIGRFFSGALLSSEMFVILMLYLWFGVGLACAGFCCHQMLLILRGQTRYQVRKRLMVRSRPWRANLQQVFGKRWLLGLLLPVLNVQSELHQLKAD